MPVASLKPNQVASNDNMDNAKTLIAIIDKKVRNLEKRKVCICLCCVPGTTAENMLVLLYYHHDNHKQ